MALEEYESQLLSGADATYRTYIPISANNKKYRFAK